MMLNMTAKRFVRLILGIALVDNRLSVFGLSCCSWFSFQQEHGRDYDETFAPVAHMTTVHTLLVVASVRAWSISQLDVKNVFLKW
jgi:hypothetical protein